MIDTGTSGVLRGRFMRCIGLAAIGYVVLVVFTVARMHGWI